MPRQRFPKKNITVLIPYFCEFIVDLKNDKILTHDILCIYITKSFKAIWKNPLDFASFERWLCKHGSLALMLNSLNAFLQSEPLFPQNINFELIDC